MRLAIYANWRWMSIGTPHASLFASVAAIRKKAGGHGPAETRHAGRDARDLIGTVHLGVPGIGAQPLDRPELDLARRKGEVHGQGGPVVLGGFGRVDSIWIPQTGFRWIPILESRNPPLRDAQSLVLLTETALRLAEWIPPGFPGKIA